MTNNPAHTSNPAPDATIDHVLRAIGSSEPNPGLEERLHNRIAEARTAEARSAHARRSHAVPMPHFIAVILTLSGAKGKNSGILLSPATRYTLTAASLAAVAVLCIFASHTFAPSHHRTTASLTQPQLPAQLTPSEGAQLHPRSLPASPTEAQLQPHSSHAPSEDEEPQPRQTSSPREGAEPQSRHSSATLEGAGLQSRHTPTLRNAALAAAVPDPDAIALAETLAPSHPAPQMHLTGQEQLLRSATRQGQPIEVAELDIARAPALHAAADAREQKGVQRLAQKLFAPITMAENLEPTTAQSQEDKYPSPASEPTTSSLN